MSVKNDASGHRSVQAEVQVPGTPEEVWRAIATGPGISSWFVPTQVEERVGGAVKADFGPGMESESTITAWDPPHRFAADSQDMGPDSPTIATEWIVEAQAGGTCVVRVVHRWFASTDDWDAQFEAFEGGWPAFFRILRLYLAHFSGQPCTPLQVVGMVPEPLSDAWSRLTGPLGLSGAALGQPVSAPDGAPSLVGVVENVGPEAHPECLIHLERPAPGIAHLFAMFMGGMVCLPIRFYLYGDRAAAAAAREEPVWQAWLAERFPAPTAAPGATDDV
jgi:uncharacterized protein YndB with AHSA1/START domain